MGVRLGDRQRHRRPDHGAGAVRRPGRAVPRVVAGAPAGARRHRSGAARSRWSTPAPPTPRSRSPSGRTAPAPRWSAIRRSPPAPPRSVAGRAGVAVRLRRERPTSRAASRSRRRSRWSSGRAPTTRRRRARTARSYPAIAAGAGAARRPGRACIPQLRKNAATRTNVGVLNVGAADVTVDVTLFGADGAQVGTATTATVAPARYWQQDDIFASAGAGTQAIAYATVEVHDRGRRGVGLRLGDRRRHRRPDDDAGDGARRRRRGRCEVAARRPPGRASTPAIISWARALGWPSTRIMNCR